jgi:hypothetical protein
LTLVNCEIGKHNFTDNLIILQWKNQKERAISQRKLPLNRGKHMHGAHADFQRISLSATDHTKRQLSSLILLRLKKADPITCAFARRQKQSLFATARTIKNKTSLPVLIKKLFIQDFICLFPEKKN